MIENRKKINFKTKIKVSSFRFLGGLFVSLLLSFSIYLFFIYCRDYTRLLTFTNNHNYLELSKKELFFYDFFFAFLSLTIGQSYFLKILFHKNRVINDEQTRLRRKIVHDQNVLIWFFMFWFIRTAGLTAFLYMNFNTEYPIDFYYDLNFYNEYWYLFVLILCVLFLQSWQALGLLLKRHYKKMFYTFLMLSLTAIVFTQIKIINFEGYFKTEHLNNLYLKENIRLPKSNSFTSQSKWGRIFQIYVSENNSVFLNNKEISLSELKTEVYNQSYFSQYYSPYDERFIQINADKNATMKTINSLRSIIIEYSEFKVYFGLYPSQKKYPDEYYQDNQLIIKDVIIDKISESINNKETIEINYSENLKFSNYIKLLDFLNQSYYKALQGVSKSQNADEFTLEYFPERILKKTIIDNTINTTKILDSLKFLPIKNDDEVLIKLPPVKNE